MERRRLGDTGHEVSVVGLGAWQIGAGPAFPAQPDDVSLAAIRAALSAGISWIDTAPAYGLGHSEELVGRALRGLAERPLVFTKCSLVWDAQGRVYSDLDPASIRRECEDSLRRLGVDVIDLYQIHWPHPPERLDDAWAALDDLRRRGLVRAIGLSNAGVEEVQRLETRARVGSVQSPYSLVRRGVEADTLPFCRAEGIGFLAYSPLASGLLGGRVSRERLAALPADDWRRGDPMFCEPHLAQHLEVVELLRAVGRERDATPAELALAWVISRPGVSGTIVGMARPEHVSAAVRAAARVSTDDLHVLGARAAALLPLPEPPDRYVPRTREELNL